MSWFWPRAERKLYEEPKRLAEMGLASSRTEMTGRRASTVYEITNDGRRRLREWVESPEFDPPSVEMEAMIRLFFADAGSVEAMTATLEVMSEQATAAVSELSAMAEQFTVGDDEFPERRATNALTMELFVRLHETISEWTVWAGDEIGTWPRVTRRRRSVGVGPPDRGVELFAAISDRAPGTTAPVDLP